MYEFVVRSFLAACSKQAIGFETTVDIDIAGEEFTTRGVTPMPLQMRMLLYCPGYCTCKPEGSIEAEAAGTPHGVMPLLT